MKAYIRNTQGRMFQSDFFEFFSKVHPAVPFLVYLPGLAALTFVHVSRGLWNTGLMALMLPMGFLTWQFMEYFIHKIWFHWEGNSPFTRRMHDILHGYHHQYPDDESRLVMPLGASLPLAFLIYGGLSLFEAPATTFPYFLGIVLGYLWYDFVHWSTHYRKPLTSWGKALRAHHMSHHFADTETNFGISHRWIDGMLGTLRMRTKENASSPG